jgi:hypothetical protein
MVHRRCRVHAGVRNTNKIGGVRQMIRRANLVPGTTAILSLIAVAGLADPARGQDVPDYWKGLVGKQAAPPEQTAASNILALNTSMFDLYDSAGQIFTKNILAKQTVILALFSGSGGNFTLYRPGQPPLQAPSVPMVYQILKSVGHSTMALAEVVGPYLTSPEDQSWRSPILSFPEPDAVGGRRFGFRLHADGVAGKR